MNPLLVILNPRKIQIVEEAFGKLDVAKCRIRGYTEAQIANGVWSQVTQGARERGFTHLTLISDDAVVPARSLRLVLDHAALNEDRVTTGWCNVNELDQTVNLSTEPLTSPYPYETSYALPLWRDVLVGPPVQRTYFTGFALTTASLEIWERFPYQVYGEGFAADYSMSRRLWGAGIKIDALRDAFVLHLKASQAGSPDIEERRLLIGEIEPGLVWELPHDA
jgi:hypothetical protein